MSAGGPPGGGKDLDLDVKIANVIGANSQALSQFELSGGWRGGVMTGMQAEGRIGNGTLSAKQDDAGVLRARVTDAGAMSKFLDLYTHMEGGKLDLTLQDAGDGSRGTANVNDFVLRNEPALQKLAAAGERGRGAGSADNTDVARFEKMSTSFTRSARPPRSARGGDLQQPYGPDHPGLSRLRAQSRRPQRHIHSRLSGQQPRHAYSRGGNAAGRRRPRRASSGSTIELSGR